MNGANASGNPSSDHAVATVAFRSSVGNSAFRPPFRLTHTAITWCGILHFASEALARISHTIFARSGGVARRFVRTCWLVASGGRERSWDFPGLRGAAKTWSRWAWDDAAVVTRCGGACHAGEPRALAAALRRTAAQPQTSAAGQLDAIAILMRRTLTRTSAPILSSLRRIVPQLALANGV